jgi:hypothetical protein
MKLLTALRRPCTLKDASRESEIADFRTPGLSSARSAYALPFSGRLTICSLPITWPRSLDSLSSSVAAPVTTTVSPTLPTLSVRSTRRRALTVT